MMTTVLALPAHHCRPICASPAESLAQRRTDALDRLLALLEGNSPALQRRCLAAGDSESHRLRRLARLRVAHASYALSSGIMQQTGKGAWVSLQK